MLDLALKRYPCCSYSQEAIEAALELVHENEFDAEDLSQAVVWVASPHAAGLVDRVYEPRSCPQVDAQFSMQYVIASALRRKALGVADFQQEALRNPAVVELSRRVRVEIDPQREGSVELRLNDGRVLSHRVPLAAGHPRRPLDRGQLREKLRECGAHAALPRTQAQLAALEQCIMELEERARGADLAALLA